MLLAENIMIFYINLTVGALCLNKFKLKDQCSILNLNIIIKHFLHIPAHTLSWSAINYKSVLLNIYSSKDNLLWNLHFFISAILAALRTYQLHLHK